MSKFEPLESYLSAKGQYKLLPLRFESIQYLAKALYALNTFLRPGGIPPQHDHLVRRSS